MKEEPREGDVWRHMGALATLSHPVPQAEPEWDAKSSVPGIFFSFSLYLPQSRVWAALNVPGNFLHDL